MKGFKNMTTTNAEQFASIREVISGGVSSSMRAQAIPEPLVVQRAKGNRIWDVEDRELIDLNMGYGPHLFGYADPELAAALARQLAEGAMTGLPHRLDRQAGELIGRLVPSVEQVRFANSGTEAVASALRLARVATGRTQVLTFEGHYHGWSETVLRAGKATFHQPAPDSTAPRPGAPGMIPGALAHTLEVPWNDLPALRAVFEAHGERLAAVICEPVMANACVVPPAPGQLEELRALCDRWGAWLIFDEVITGFRVARGGAQERYGVTPDLTVLSKVMGGGVPVAAFGGSRAAMAMLADQRALAPRGLRRQPPVGAGGRHHAREDRAHSRNLRAAREARRLPRAPVALRVRRDEAPGPGQPGRLAAVGVVAATAR